MEYGYVRVSSRDQNVARQMDDMKRLGIPKDRVFIDYQSGKDFERKNYKRLLSVLKKSDLVAIKSIDRLGRDYQMIIDEWRRITKVIGADILVIDMPLLDTRETGGQGLVGRFISDIVLQILSFVAENERTNIKERQAEGIKLAKERGVRFGRPRKGIPEKAGLFLEEYRKGAITAGEAARRIGISRSTFFKLRSEKMKANKK